MLQNIDIERAITAKIIDSEDNPTRREDYQRVRSFSQLKGGPSRPVDPAFSPRDKDDFESRLTRLDGIGFFDPFNRMLDLVGRSRITIAAQREVIDSWNDEAYGPRLVSEICDKLDRGSSPLLVPRLVALFINLERELPPEPDDWAKISAIVVPGSRTLDRAAEAFRAYLRTAGRACVVTSGKAPYYDDNETIQLTESEANAAYLRLLGVPGERIIMESTSRDTTENAEFLPSALALIDARGGPSVECVLLITSPFHLARYRLGVETVLAKRPCKVLATGSKASRYWAETYFLSDAKSGYSREATIGVVINEYLKIAFDVCAVRRKDSKEVARRGPSL